MLPVVTEYKIPGKYANPEWATYADIRKPKFKVHSTLGQAKNAIAQKMPHHPVQLLHFEEGEWRIHWEYTLSVKCDRCNGSFKNKWGHDQRFLPHREYRDDHVMYCQVICEGCYYKESVKLQEERQEKRDREAYERLKAKFGDSNEV